MGRVHDPAAVPGRVHLPDHPGPQHDRAQRRARAARDRAQFDEYVRTTATAGGAAAEIDKAKQLLDSGAITQPEFEALKQKALAA